MGLSKRQPQAGLIALKYRGIEYVGVQSFAENGQTVLLGIDRDNGHLAAEEYRHTLHCGISACSGEHEGVADFEGVKLRRSCENVVGGAEAAAECPRSNAARCFVFLEVKDNGNLHSLKLSVVFKLVKTAVYNRVVYAVAGLDVDNLCEVVTAGSGKESAHLNGELGDFTDFTDSGRDVGKTRRFELVSVFVEVIDRETGSVLKALNSEVELVLDLAHKLLEIVELAQNRLCLALLGSGEVVDTNDLHTLVVCAVTDKVEHVALFHTELGSALYVGNAEQNGKYLASAERGFVDKLQMQEALGSEGAYVVVGSAFNVLKGLVDIALKISK